MSFLIHLDYQSRLPIYEQIIEEIIRYVALGVLNPNDVLPSIRDLASSLGINPNTVKKAYTELEHRGVIVTISTKGSFIAEDIQNILDRYIDKEFGNIQESIERLQKLGLTKEEILKRIKQL